tara:strand:+ start:12 stop:176 length:165 start_codon:yes stop_codon:yes gene_type:complete
MKKQNWKPADKFKVKKLRRAGPKKGQSVNAYMYGKTKGKNYENPNELTQSKTTN